MLPTTHATQAQLLVYPGEPRPAGPETLSRLVRREDEEDSQHYAQQLLDLEVCSEVNGCEARQARRLQAGAHAAEGLVRGRQQLLGVDLVQPQLLQCIASLWHLTEGSEPLDVGLQGLRQK